MAKRELSTTLRNLKFMQRAAPREGKIKKEEEVKPDGNFFSQNTIKKKCVVIMEGDPHPGAVKGRMSFQSFNPSIDKLNEEAGNPPQPEAPASCSTNQSGKLPNRENGSSVDGAECLDNDKLNTNGDLKRKQSEVVPETQYPNKSPKNVQGNQQSSSNKAKGSYKQQKRDKLDWNVLRPPKSQNKSG